MKIVFDISKMQPACAILQAVMGGDTAAASRFPSSRWLIAPTPGMRLYEINDTELNWLAAKVEAWHDNP